MAFEEEAAHLKDREAAKKYFLNTIGIDSYGPIRNGPLPDWEASPLYYRLGAIFWGIIAGNPCLEVFASRKVFIRVTSFSGA